MVYLLFKIFEKYLFIIFSNKSLYNLVLYKYYLFIFKLLDEFIFLLRLHHILNNIC